MAAHDLTDLATVRSYLQKQTGDVGQDAIINVFISAASRLILAEFEREFAPVTAAATRRFELDVEEPYLDLAPYDLRTLTSLTIDPQDGGPVLVEHDDFRLKPRPAKDGVVTGVEFHRLPTNTTRGTRHRLVDIAGAWGFAAVPEDVKHWATLACVIWLRGNVAAFSTVYNLDESRVERPESLPGAVVRGLKHYRRRA